MTRRAVTRRAAGRHGRARTFTAALLAATTLLAGACGLPRTSAIQQGHDMGPAPLPPVRVEFAGPQRGATPEAVVRGFLAAGWATQDDYRTARAYLTPEAARDWDPRAGVTVYGSASDVALTAVADDRLELAVADIARLDDAGRYTARPVGSRRVSRLTLTRSGGEWRISALEPEFGVWLARPFFESAYRPFAVAYTSARSSTVVADRRWFPLGSGLGTTLARSLLGPVPGYLAGAVASGFPAGTSLVLDAVPVVGGAAEVDLSATMLRAGADQRRRAWAQALETMKQVPDVSSVRLRVAERDLDVGTIPGVPGSAASLGFEVEAPDPAVVVRRVGTEVRALDLGAFTPLDRGEDPPPAGRLLARVPPGWGDVVASDDLVQVAAVDDDRRELRRWRAGVPGSSVRLGAGLTPAAYDRSGWVWVGGQDPSGRARVWALDPGTSASRRAPAPLQAPWLAGRRVQAVLPAPDGARALVVSRTSRGRLELGVSGIVPDEQGRPSGLAEPWPVGGDLVDAGDAAWIDAEHLAVVGARTTTSAASVFVVPLGGGAQELSALRNPRRVVATTGGGRGLLVLATDGSVNVRVGGGWAQVGRADDLAVPGR
ncbi:GerMN domain-containing protein [Agilicoccus flavus]|uniref:GerMN domain-containing protein n=1 Tax=Agilicoccus flavus TaxID=2775968 RepID=UPI001CF60E3C|nr:LpqB family beta-propeller domain-containing protein [Agilicoccus flavus]